MKKIICYTTTALVISCGMAQAQTCVPTPDCQTLGYTSSSYCSGGLKCPFGNYWNCDAVNCELSGKVTELTEKIVELEEKIAAQGQAGSNSFCSIGNIFYSDKSCSSRLDSSKTAIGVVVYTDGNGHGQVIALKSLDTEYTWGGYGTDLSVLPNYSEAASAANDYGSCENSYLIMSVGDSSTYPAVWAANEYSTEGTSAGDWCLPAAGIFTSIYNNMTTVNVGLLKAGGTQFTTSTYAWSSSENYSSSAWCSDFSSSYGLYDLDGSRYKNDSAEVRPVLAF